MSMRFSQRMGFTPVRDALQIDDMDDTLRNRLWNLAELLYWEPVVAYANRFVKYPQAFHDGMSRLWSNYLGRSLHEMPARAPARWYSIREYYFNSFWPLRYDLLEALPSYFQTPAQWEVMFNGVLEEEMSGYRVIGGQTVPISSELEVAAIEQATKTETPYAAHLRSALALLSDRQSPDYRNSVKESISAVESICCEITGNPSATLGQAIKGVTDAHPALRRGVHEALRLHERRGWDPSRADGGLCRAGFCRGQVHARGLLRIRELPHREGRRQLNRTEWPGCSVRTADLHSRSGHIR
jgi:AbiJ N-terminal domain 4